LYLLMRPVSQGGRQAIRTVAVIAGLAALAWILVDASRWIGAGGEGPAAPERPGVIFVIFSLIAIASAVRMITHPKPVYCALYFIMVVLSSAGLFLLLQAEFMAFALIIVYAGAILITYMFVLMLAQQTPSATPGGTGAEPGEPQPDYDRIPREPGMAATVAFIMLALFTNMIFTGAGQLEPHTRLVDANIQTWKQLKLMPKQVQEVVDRVVPGAKLAPAWNMYVEDGTPWVDVIRPGDANPTSLALPQNAFPTNVQLVGLDLVTEFPASLELAGVILLLAMFGAVVLARKQIEIGEDETREAAGMRRLALHSDEHAEPGPHAELAKGGA
jgi:NADH-quinone oxidoreductase subunit J